MVGDACTLCGACVESCEAAGPAASRGRKRAVRSTWPTGPASGSSAEFRHGVIAPVSFELLGVGRKLADQRGVQLSAVLFGAWYRRSAGDLIAHGADQVYVADRSTSLAQLPGRRLRPVSWSSLIREQRPEMVLAGATAIGRSFIPQVATTLNAGLTADCTDLDIRAEDGALLQTRPAFGGNIMATIDCPPSRPQMATVRPKVMEPLDPDPGADRARSSSVGARRSCCQSRVGCWNRSLSRQDKVNIQEVDILVAGGRGLENEKGFELLRELAEELGGAVAASRAAVDAGWIPYPHQVGQTGKTVCPKLYIACGISGAVQHVVGMQSSETIVAINRDENAPIFDVATYGMVGDLFEIVPLLTKKIRENRGQ